MPKSPVVGKSHTGDFDVQSPSVYSMGSNSSSLFSPAKNLKPKPGLKRALTSQNGTPSKNDEFRQHSRQNNPLLEELQRETAIRNGMKDIARFERRLLPKRNLLGNAAAVKLDRIARIERNRALFAGQLSEKRAELKKVQTREKEFLPEETSVVVEAEIIRVEHRWTPFSKIVEFDKTNTSKETAPRYQPSLIFLESCNPHLWNMDSPFCSSRYRRKIGYGPQHFFDELNEEAENKKNITASGDGDTKSDNGSISSGIDSSGSDSDDDTCTVTSSMMISRSASLKFVDDMFMVDVKKFQKSMSIQEETDEGEEDVPYNGIPKEANYFGENARNNFFGLFNKLSRQFQSGGDESIERGSKKPQSPTPTSHPPSPKSNSRPQSAARRGRRPAKLDGVQLGIKAVTTSGLDGEFDDDDFDIFDLSDNEGDEKRVKNAPKYSPRHRFLQQLIKDKKVAPLPIIIRRSPDDDELNLAHRSLGDDYIIYLSSVIHDLPNLSKVNLRDNRLTDRGMGKFIHALAAQQRLTHVDLSENKIDSKSADALTHYLKRPDCTLTMLRMSNADLDDDEVAIFMDALEANRSITELDVSHNKLGGIGEKSVKFRGNILTGGAAIAQAISKNQTLHCLNLSWNKLGFATAVHLGSALIFNSTLLDLNLAYNTIRDDGAELIGNALMFNSALTSLDVSHNGIGSLGTFVIATGMRLNPNIKVLNMSGNPIGSQGCMFLMQTLNYHPVEREFHLHQCSFDENMVSGNGTTTKLNMVYPTGKYNLDLSKPRFKCMLIELYRLASIRRGCNFKGVEYKSGQKFARKHAVKLRRAENPADWRGQPYGPWKYSTPRERHPYTKMEAKEWMEIEHQLFLRDESTGERWDVPSDGTVSFDFVYVPRCACPIDCLNATGLKRFMKILNTHPKECLSILKTCGNIAMESYQADEIMGSLDDSIKVKERIEIFSYLMLCIRDTSNTSALFPKHMRILNSLKDVQQSLRNMFYIATNAFSGHYQLDLDNYLDRLAGVRLMEISADERAYIQHVMPSWNTPTHGYTSQKQNKSNFRNERFQRMVVEKGCVDEFFSHGLEDKNRGVLEFDFVSTTRPVDEVEAMSSHHLDHMLKLRGLKNAATIATQAMKMARRRTMQLSVGNIDPTGENPLSVDFDLNELPTQTWLAPISSLPTLDTSEEIMYTPCPKPIKAPPSFDPSAILGHYVVDLNFRFVVPVLPTSADDVFEHMMAQEYGFTSNLRHDDLSIIANDINKDNALYIGKSTLERYTVNLCVRILNPSSDLIFEPISFIRKDGAGYEAFGHGKADLADKPTSTTTIMDLLGLSGENAKYEIGTVHVPNIQTLNPTHRKYVINDDMYIMGSDIYCKLKCEEWSMESISLKAMEVCTRLFSCIGVANHAVRVVNHRTADAKTSEFLTHKFADGVSNHIVLQQLDVCITGIPEDATALLKAYVNSGKGAIVEDASAVINTLWRWRNRTANDRGSSKIDLVTHPYDFWGMKFLLLRAMISSFWLSCQQALRIVMEFPLYGYDAQPHRESAIVCVFSRLVDPENIELLLASIHQNSHAGLYQRLGWLNVINAWDVDKLFSIDLSFDDARIIAIMLAKFAAVEPGDNFISPKFRRSSTDLFVPGWDLPASWTIDPDKAKAWDGVPRKGDVLVIYSSAPEFGCKLIPAIRKLFFEKYTLLAVPRGPGDDFYLQDNNPSDWDN